MAASSAALNAAISAEMPTQRPPFQEIVNSSAHGQTVRALKNSRPVTLMQSDRAEEMKNQAVTLTLTGVVKVSLLLA